MKKRFICLLLALVMAVGVLPGLVFAADAWKAETVESRYFYDQLNPRAKAIYSKLLNEFTGKDKASYYGGTKTIDLMGTEGVDLAAVEAYIAGSKELFNDFCAAKDALDLDHSEIWWMDSGYLTFRVTQDSAKSGAYEGYHVIIGPGRGDTYLLGGQTIDKVAEKDREVNAAIDKIVTGAVSALNANSAAGGFSQEDKIAYLTGYIHDQITQGIHYRYEIECRDNGANAKYIRTIYGFATHEGVCEAYARTLQVALRRLGIQCVLIHGVQTKGTPEDHMWNAVNIPDAKGAHWYAVDATWDDPLAADYTGKRDLTFAHGLDGKETNTYLLVGQAQVGEYWRPSGFVSTGTFEFSYPTIEADAYAGASLDGDYNGLEVKYSAGASMEDHTPAGVFTVTYKGMNAAQAKEKGLYFMVKMYDYHADGTADVMDEWYYADASFILASDNRYFGDHKNGLRIYTATCEYVDIAVTTREPDHRSEWSTNPSTSYLSQHPEAGYFQGDESEIIAQTGMLYNVNASYEAPPYVLTQTPAPNGNATAGYQYRFKVTFDDDLYHILPEGNDAATVYGEDYARASTQKVQLRYVTRQQDLHSGGEKTVQIAGELPFDANRDGVVDMTGGYTEFKWIYKYDGKYAQCPNHAKHKGGQCDVEAGCPIVGVEFNFRASDLWIDDVTEYNFSVEGVVGSRSAKFPNNFSVICTVPGLCPACYRSQGIDWNLWGQPTLLDAPEDLDLHDMAVAGGTDKETLNKLDDEMRRDELNGRLMLVVEDKSQGAGNRQEYEELNEELAESAAGKELSGQEIAARMLFEINFNRLCPMVKLKPNQGQSLRVQVGYPAGVTYESLGKGEYELMAYHFTRCAENERCKEFYEEYAKATNDLDRAAVKASHDWGAHIISVEKITVIPTPYGMVLMCDAFSPFEIVAVKKNNAVTSVSDGPKTVVVVSDGNGTVSVDNHDTVGKGGNVEFTSGASKTFTVTPDPGYAVDTVSLGGKAIQMNGDGNTFTVSNVTKNDVLSVTFLPETVKQKEEAQYGATVVAQVCDHTNTVPFVEAGHTEGKEATCTADGWKMGTKCSKCGQIITHGQVIPATGHRHTEVRQEAKEPTCTENGSTAQIWCNDCKTYISNASEVQALGHLFKNYTSTGVTSCKGTEMTATCERCHTAVDKHFDASVKSDHKFVNYVYQHDATCTKNGTEKGACVYCGAVDVREKEGTMLPHDLDPDTHICRVCHEYACAGGHTPKTVPGKAATCTENGLSEGQICSVCGEVLKIQDILPAQGHTFPTDHAEKDVACQVCGQVMKASAHTPEDIPAVAPTCDAEGLTKGVRCALCHHIIEKQEVLPALGHQYDTEKLAWVWSTDGLNHAAATVPCVREGCTHQETLAAQVTLKTMTEAGCTSPGSAVATASVTVGEETFTDTRTVELPALGHDVIGGVCARCGRNIGDFPSHPVIRPYDNFADVPGDAWYEEELEYVNTRGIMLGGDGGNFKPNENISRVQMMTLLARFDLNAESSGENWHDASIDWAVKADISDGQNPEAFLTREDCVTMLWRYYGEPLVDYDLSAYPDQNQVNTWSRDALKWAVSEGIITGTGDGGLAPLGTATRAEAACIFARFAQLVEG